MNFSKSLKCVKRDKFFKILIPIAAIALLYFYKSSFGRTTPIGILLSELNQNFVSSDDQFNHLLSNRYPLLDNADLQLTEEVCNKEDYVNSQRLEQDHPCVIEIIQRNYLHYPPAGDAPLSLDRPDVEDPSAGQSGVVLPYVGNKTGGFFVECGAGDGETLSNTLFMERTLKWGSVLIEADRKFFRQILTKKRRVFALPVCLSLQPYPTEVSFYEDGIAGEIYGDKINSQEEKVTTDVSFKLVNVQCFPLYSILLAVGRTELDYFSVDVEGSESQILMNIPWNKVHIKTLTVEVTSRSQVIVDSLTRYMQKQGYKKVELMAGLGYYDLVFVLNTTTIEN